MNYLKLLLKKFLFKNNINLTSFKEEDYYFVIKKRVNEQDYYLRFCSTTGEPLWEDRITQNTEKFNYINSAQHEIDNYFIKGIMNKCKVEPILKSNFSSSYNVNTKSYYGLNQ